MKTKYLIFTALIIVLIISGCKKESDDDPEIPKSENIINDYSGSGSEGDLITFSINQTNNSYSIVNETTSVSDNGTYSVMNDSNFNGIYKVNIGTSDFYAVELSDKILAANFPTGNPNNNISFGVSSELDNTSNISNIKGDYVFMVMDNNGIMSDPTIKEWGILTLNDSTWFKKNFATNTGDGSVTEMSPDLYTGSLPLTSGDESGKWNVDGTNKERLNVTIDGIPVNLSGYVYATASEASFVLDLGTGNGFLLGLKITNSISFSDIQGDYKFVNVWDNGFGAGNYSINSTGYVNWYHDGSDGATTGNFQLTQCSNIFKNVFYVKNTLIDTAYYEDIYCVIIGDIIMHFSFDASNGNFAQYGTGGRIN